MAWAVDGLASKYYPGERGEIRVESTQVVFKFGDVFLDEILGLPPHRVVDFMIELHPGTLPISMTPHRMAPI